MKIDLALLEKVFCALDDDAARNLASLVSSHERVFVYGAGRSGLMLKAFAMRLAQAGRCVYVVGETVTPAIGKGDLLLLASASGTTESVLRYARIALDLGAEVCAVTASEASPLTALGCKYVLLPTQSKDAPASGTENIMGTVFEQALLLLCDAAVRELGADVTRMRARHANLE